ncbi:MAG: glycosyl hydrolase 53 family protein [Lachnospiraceae bacterium]|nr:glycosyl hydrolase 53 family protein [Lachnospiraceae bacterium]
MKKRKLSVLAGTMLLVGILAGCGQGVAKDAVTDTLAETDTAVQTESKPITDPYIPTLPTGIEEADIFVEPVEGLAEDFMLGMDISSIIAQEDSGVVYYNEAGEEEDLFRILADAGVNYIRVRVWNDPYDKNGMGYGGGNNDVEKAVEIAGRAAENGMKLLVDFHYSDFWADPKKQYAPKEWAHITLEDKKTAIYDFTKESLEAILATHVEIGMVQIGNEINNGMSGETDATRVMELLKQASKAVRDTGAEAGQDIKIAVHYTEIDDYNYIMGKAATLEKNGLDYDVFGISYYPYWHGTMENMKKVIQDIQTAYGKEVAVVETSYAYTLEDGDGYGNSVGESDLVEGYAATVQSQANCVRDMIAAANEAGALGLFYWEGAWIPVGSDATSNEKIWEEHGSGWASSYSAKYDPKDAGLYYGGCSWDNQAFFDWEGHPLASLDVFKYVRYGATCEPAIDYLEQCEVKVNMGEELVMPTGVPAVYNDRSLSKEVPVVWDETQVAAIDTSKGGEYVVKGTLEDGTAVECPVSVAFVNWIENPGFEEKKTTMWNVTYAGSDNPTDIQNKEADCTSGVNSFHFWSNAAQEFKVEQTVSGLAAGNYTATASIQGGDVGSNAEIYLYVIVNGEEIKSEPVTLAGWVNWQEPMITDIALDGASDITVGMSVKCAGGGWGTMDDFMLYKQ